MNKTKKRAGSKKSKNKKENTKKLKSGKHLKKSKDTIKIPKNIVNSLLAIVGIIAIILIITNIDLIFPKKTVVAVVNGEEITAEQIDELYKTIPAQFQMLVSKEQVLNQTITEVLLLQEAKKEGIITTNKDVKDFIETQLSNSGITMEQFEDSLKLQNTTYDKIIKIYKTQLTINALINKTLNLGVIITEQEIRDHYNENKDLFTTSMQVKASHILLETENEAQQILNKVKAGQDFAELAVEYSTGPSASSGGDLGYFGRGAMVKEFETAAFNLDVGQVSAIVQTQFGYHIIKVTDKKLGETQSFDEVKDQIKEQIIKEEQQEYAQRYIQELKDNALIEIYGFDQTNPESSTGNGVLSFEKVDGEICKENGKPIIRLFSTTVCPHCTWIKNTFDNVMEEYSDKIVAYHWEFDIGDNTLTDEKEIEVPMGEQAVYSKFSTGAVPTFVFGCKYIRVGNAYESQNDLEAEADEFRQVIELLLE